MSVFFSYYLQKNSQLNYCLFFDVGKLIAIKSIRRDQSKSYFIKLFLTTAKQWPTGLLRSIAFEAKSL